MLADLFTNIEALSQDILAKPLPLVIASIVVVLVTLYLRASADSKVEQLNPKKLSDVFGSQTKADFNQNAGKLLRDWFKKNPDKPTAMYTDMGHMTVLPASLANEIRNDNRLDFQAVSRKTFHAGLPGFEIFGAANDFHIIQKVITKDLTKQLTQVTAPLSEETSMVLEDLISNNPEWHEVALRDTILRVVARISSRVFLGEQLCRNEEWLRVTREYTVTVFNAAQDLRMYPSFLRPIVCRFLPGCKEAKAQVAKAREVIAPVLKSRQAMKKKAADAGERYTESNDAIDWFEELSDGKNYDPAMTQLGLSFAAIHTTTDLLTQTLIDIAAHPEIKEALREEMVRILQTDGWAKTAFYKMKLLDSTIKESQRLKPISMTSMTRIAKENIKLSDGTVLRKGEMVCVTSNKMWDDTLYEKVDQWNPYRFLEMREHADKQHVAQLVSTSPDHLAFGHGQHACPGRFFAANEVKIALITILLKYDVALMDGCSPSTFTYGFTMNPDPMVKLQVRRRQEEVPI